MEINFKQTLFSLESRNRKCNDCGDDGVKYVSVNNGITLCELCAQIHKNFGNQISYLKSIDEEFDDYLMGFFIYGGNKKFRRTLKQMGVNLDVKKGHLYRTYGVDFYRRNLKSLVKGNSHLDKDYDNPNEVMKNDSNSFPEFNNYIVHGNNNNNNNINNQNNNNNMRKKDIFITFTFAKYNKQIFIDVNGEDLFQNVLKELEDKYNWLKSLNGKKYFYNNEDITNSPKTINKLKLVDNSNIVITVT